MITQPALLPPNPEVAVIAAATLARFNAHLRDGDEAISELRATGVGERRIEALYPHDWREYHDCLHALLQGEALNRLAEITADLGARRALFRLSDGSEVKSSDDRTMISGNDQHALLNGALTLADQLSTERETNTHEREVIARSLLLTYAILQALHRITAGESASSFLATTFGTFDLGSWHDNEVLPVLHLLDELQPAHAATTKDRTLTGVPERLIEATTFPFAAKMEITIRPLPSSAHPVASPTPPLPVPQTGLKFVPPLQWTELVFPEDSPVE